MKLFLILFYLLTTLNAFFDQYGLTPACYGSDADIRVLEWFGGGASSESSGGSERPSWEGRVRVGARRMRICMSERQITLRT